MTRTSELRPTEDNEIVRSLEEDNSTGFLIAVENNDFLPSVSHFTRLTGLALTGIVGIAFTLASMISYKVVVKGQASVRPAGEMRLVQAATDGTVVDIIANENQEIKRGDLIALLDNSSLHIQKSKLNESVKYVQSQLSNLDFQIQSLSNQIIAESNRNDKAIISAEATLENSRRQYRDNESLTKSAFEEAAANLRSTQAAYEVASSKWKKYQPLAEAGAISKEQLMEAKLAVDQQEQAIEVAAARFRQAHAALNPSHSGIIIAFSGIEQERALGAATLANLQREMKGLTQRRLQLQDQLAQDTYVLQQLDLDLIKTKVTATEDGIIASLNIRNPGQALRSGEEIARIAPKNSGLIVKALIASQDIGKVAVGQMVQLRISACPYPDYGVVEGIVSSISPDLVTSFRDGTTQPSVQGRTSINQGESAFYEVNIDLTSLHLQQQDNICHIQVGMEGRADIISKEETVLRFLLRKARLVTDF